MPVKNNHIWNVVWAIIAGLLTMWNIISLVFYILQGSWIDVFVIAGITTVIGYIFITSIRRLLKEEKHDTNIDNS